MTLTHSILQDCVSVLSKALGIMAKAKEEAGDREKDTVIRMQRANLYR